MKSSYIGSIDSMKNVRELLATLKKNSAFLGGKLVIKMVKNKQYHGDVAEVTLCFVPKVAVKK